MVCPPEWELLTWVYMEHTIEMVKRNLIALLWVVFLIVRLILFSSLTVTSFVSTCSE